MATHDYVIDNSTGANVRADINSVLQAILTNNSNSSTPSTTAAYMFWADTSNGVLKIRNSANNAWVELFQLDGTLTLEDGSASTPALAFRDDLNTGIFSPNADEIGLSVGGTEKFRFTGTGLGIGTVAQSITPQKNLHIAEDSSPRMMLSNDTTGHSSGSGTELVLDSSGNFEILQRENLSVEVFTNNTQRMTIDGSGRLLLGTSTARAVGGESNPRLHIEGSGNTSNSWVNLTRFQDGTAGANFQFAKARSNTPGTYTVVQSGDTLGTISFLGADGTDMANYAATISAQVDNTPGSNDMPGRLVFSTTADGAGTVTERMRIKSNGSVAIGTTNGSARLMVARDIADSASNNFDNQTVILTGSFGGNSTNNRTGLYFAPYNSSNQYCPSAISCTAGSNYQSTLKFFTNAAGNGTGHVESYERMRITTTGVIGVGKTANFGAGSVAGIELHSSSHYAMFVRSGGEPLFVGRNTNTGTLINFLYGGNAVGTISTDGSNTAYNTSSDYRLKENATAISDGITRIKTLKPYRFNFKVDKDKTVDGFFAHEVTPAVPEAITGTKDEVDSDNNPVYQGIDQSKLVPLLVAAVQEAVGKIEVLETKVAALEAA